jgi:hypothetical protein
MSKTQVADAISVGTKIRVKEGVASPEFPDISYAGWAGSVVERTGKKSSLKYVIEWDDQTIDDMPTVYRDLCEQNSLFYRMACFDAKQIERIDD